MALSTQTTGQRVSSSKMARELSNGKRKTPDVEADKSEDDGFDAVLDGVLSQSEDDFESDDASSDADGDLEGDLEGTAKESNGDQGEGDGELDIDGIPPGADEVERPAGDGDHDDSGDDKPNYRVTTDANGGVRFEYDEIDAVYDSDDTDAQEVENTIGNIPLSFVSGPEAQAGRAGLKLGPHTPGRWHALLANLARQMAVRRLSTHRLQHKRAQAVAAGNDGGSGLAARQRGGTRRVDGPDRSGHGEAVEPHQGRTGAPPPCPAK